MATSVLPDDMVMEIMSRLPLKSFCRFKCVCKSWLAFPSNPYYRQKLPRTPIGLLYQLGYPDTTIHLARLPSTDLRLGLVPCELAWRKKEYPIELQDCSNGLLLFNNGHPMASLFKKASNFIVYNPATREWMALPDTQPRLTLTFKDLRLCFDPLWSQHFYIFEFCSPRSSGGGEICTEVNVFYSEDSKWSSCLWKSEFQFYGSSCFINGVLYVRYITEHSLLALNAPDASTQWLNHRIIRLPGFPNGPEMLHCWGGHLCQSSGSLCYAQQELHGCMMRIWSLECPDRWVVKHRVSMVDVFGRDMLLRPNMEGKWYFDYDILAFDLERELVIIDDKIDDMIILVSVSTGKGSLIQMIPRYTSLRHSVFYVAYYGKVPALVA